MTDAQPLDREAAIRAWEADPSVAGKAGARKRWLPWLLIGGVVAIGAVAFVLLAGGSVPPASPPGRTPAVAGRQAVGELKPPSATSSRPTVAAEPAPADTGMSASAPSPAAVTPEEQRRAQALREARLKSSLVVTLAAVPLAETNVTTTTSTTTDTRASDANSAFAQRTFAESAAGSVATRRGDLERRILQGKFIDAVLESGIHSDLPGRVRALVQAPVFGEQGRLELIPAGTRLIGAYNAQLRKGQSRVFVVWTRALLPDGTEVTLDSPGTDALGAAGVAGEVDHHFAQVFGVSALLSILGVGAATGGVEAGDGANSEAAYRQTVSESFAGNAESVLAQYAGIPPTIRVAPGTRVRVFVNRDLDFRGVRPAAAAGERGVVHVFAEP